MQAIKISLDLMRKSFIQHSVKQYDDVPLEIYLHEDGVPLDLTGADVDINVVKDDNSFIIQSRNITINNNCIITILERDSTRVSGKTKVEVKTVLGNKQKSTFEFYLDVIGSILEGAVESSNTVTIIEELQTNIVQAKNENDRTENLIKNGGAGTKREIYRAYEDTKMTTVPRNDNFGIITIIDDDSNINFWTKNKAIFDKYGVKCSIATITSWVGGTGIMSLEQLKQLQSEGYDILSHTHSHDANIYKNNISSISDEVIENDMKASQDWLKANGFDYDTIVYAWGNFGNEELRYKKIARKFYKFGVNGLGSYNLSPNDNMYLNRVFISKNDNFDNLKAVINGVKTNSSWLILGMHSGDITNIDTTFLDSVLSYIREQNIPIMNFHEALSYKANALSVGEYKSDENFYVGNNGNVLRLPYNNYNLDVTNFKQTFVINPARTKMEQNDYLIKGSICIENTSKNGNLAMGELLVQITPQNKSIAVSKWVMGMITLADGTLMAAPFEISKSQSESTIKIKSMTIITTNNIRWVDVEIMI